MNVLALVTDAYGAYGGIAQYNRDFLEAAAGIEWIDRIDVLSRVGSLARVPSNPKIHVHAPLRGRTAYSVKAIVQCLRHRPNLIFNGHLYHAPLAQFLARAFGARCISQLHGTEIWEGISRGHAASLRDSDSIFCVSADTRNRLLEHLKIDDRKVGVLHNTVSRDFSPGDKIAARVKFGIKEQETVILTVGRLDTRRNGYKGHTRVINALADPQMDKRNIRYLVAGVGPDKERLAGLVNDLDLQDVVSFLGEVPFEDLPDLYRASDLFALPSTGEGFGIVFIEAMACGTPAIGLDIGGSPDALGHGDLGWCVKEEEFTEKLREALGAPKPNPTELSNAVLKRFGKPAFAKNLHDALVHFRQP